MENYLEAWRTLEELTISLKKNGIQISDTLMEKLRSTRATINIYEADPTYGDTIALIESYLGDLEATLVSLAEEELGKNFADEWLKKISEARSKEVQEPEALGRFVPGVPRSDYWIRIKIDETISREELQDMVTKQGLSTSEQEADYVVIHGEESKVKEIVKVMAKRMREKRGKT
ncbi:MAG: DUF2096 family protein [Candidatus Bathyarchaeota archaeon]|nr:MAG: DUF2096 family protein [Candidatus Bathyarchaeota archaeon]